MAETFDFDLFVIGGGSGGVRAARMSAQMGARVGLAEEFRMGGTCVIRGCVPKKLLVYASRMGHEFEDAAGFGWTVTGAAFDWPTLIANKDKEIARLEAAYTRNLHKAGVVTFAARAVLEDAHTVHLLQTGERFRAKHILIATGGRPNLDATLPGVENVITSNEAFDLPALPKRVIVAGGGYIAVEFAGIFAGLGAETTLLYRGEQILRGFDDDVRAAVRAEYERRGIRVITGEVFTRIEKTAHGLEGCLTNGQTLAADQIMFAIGRSPNTARLGLEKAGVETSRTGAIVVDDHSRSSAPNIYAVGDVTDRVALTPVAIREGAAVAQTLFGAKPSTVDYHLIPTAVFSSPEIGTVGLTEAEARARHGAIDIYKASFRPMRLSLTDNPERMLMKLIVAADTDRVVGCHIVGHDAAEIVQAVAIAMRMGATKADFDATMALHPSAAEELVTMREKWVG